MFAPMSRSVTGCPVRLSVTAIPGRRTPGIVPRPRVAAPTQAPVFPMPTTALARPSRSASTQRAIELSGFERRAWAGESLISTTCEACWSWKPGSPPYSRSSDSMRGRSPTRSRRSGGTRRALFPLQAASAPLRVASGASSPPITSRAISEPTMDVLSEVFLVEDLGALLVPPLLEAVVAAVVAHAVRLDGGSTAAALVGPEGFERQMRAALALAAPGCSTLGIRHGGGLGGLAPVSSTDSETTDARYAPRECQRASALAGGAAEGGLGSAAEGRDRRSPSCGADALALGELGL